MWPEREIDTLTEPATLSVTSKLDAGLRGDRARDDRGRVERRAARPRGRAERRPAARAAEVQAGSMLSAAALRVRFVAFAGKLHVPESQFAEIE